MPESVNGKERFTRLATKRTRKVLKAIDVLGNCSNRQYYSYDAKQIESIFEALESKLGETKSRFETKSVIEEFEVEPSEESEEARAPSAIRGETPTRGDWLGPDTVLTKHSYRDAFLQLSGLADRLTPATNRARETEYRLDTGMRIYLHFHKGKETNSGYSQYWYGIKPDSLNHPSSFHVFLCADPKNTLIIPSKLVKQRVKGSKLSEGRYKLTIREDGNQLRFTGEQEDDDLTVYRARYDLLRRDQ